MSQLLSVRGGRRLEGEVTIQGAKNSVLPILAATLLARGQVALLGCPRLRDVDASIRILRHLGCDAHWEADALAVDTTALRRCEISDVLMREMRSSAIFLSTSTLRACGTWGRRSGRRAASSTAGRTGCGAGKWCCGCHPWGPRRI